MSEEYGIYATIGADDSGFQATYESVNASLTEWGFSFDKLYDKGASFFKGFGVDIDQFASKLGTTGPKLTASIGIAVLAFESLSKAINVTTQDWAEDETAILKFNAAIAANASMTEGAAERLDALAVSFASLTGNEISAMESMIAMLSATGRTEEQINKMMEAATGLSVATGVDLNTALTQINQTFAGTAGRLGRVTPALNELTKEQLENGDAVDILVEKYGAYSSTLAQSTDVSLKNYKNAFSELRSVLGQFFESGIKPIRDVITNIVMYLVNHKDIVIGVIEGIGYAIAIVIGLFNPILGGIALVITGLFSLQNAVGGWKLLWLETQKVALIVVKAVLDYVSELSNAMISGINEVLEAYNYVSEKLGGKKIQLLDKVDIATASGITRALADLDAQIKTTREANAALKKTAVADTVATVKVNADAAKMNIEWAEKERDARLASLEKQEAADLSLAKSRQMSAAETLKILDDYDRQELALFYEKIEAERKASIDEANAKNADAATIANINKYYDELKTAYAQEQVDTRIALEQDFTNAMNKENEKREKEAEKASKKIKTDWEIFYDSMESNVKTWGAMAADAVNTMTSAFGDAFTSMGEAIANSGDAWGAFASAALSGIADVISAMGKQLAAMAVFKLVMGDLGGAAAAAAGAAAAFVASGLVKAWADSYAETGQDYTIAGNYVVGERGPELVTLPQGARVDNAQRTARGAQAQSSGDTYNIHAGQNLSAYEIAREIRDASRQMAFVKGLA